MRQRQSQPTNHKDPRLGSTHSCTVLHVLTIRRQGFHGSAPTRISLPCLQLYTFGVLRRSALLRHSPRIMAPALRKRFTTPESCGTTDSNRLYDPAVVFIPGYIAINIDSPLQSSPKHTFKRDGRNIVFHQNRDSMERAPRAEKEPLLIQRRSFPQCRWIGLDHGAKHRPLQIHFLDAGKVSLSYQKKCKIISATQSAPTQTAQSNANLDQINARKLP